jgi:hypothetical protein
MTCRITLDLNEDPADVLARARSAIIAAGGTLTGDADSGEIAAPTPVGRIAGTYETLGRSVTFTITNKPMLVSCAMIEGKLRELAGN